METTPLTKRQNETLQLIEGYIDEYNIAPTVRELASLMGLNTTSSVSRILADLEVGGHIKRTRGPRGIQLTARTQAAKLAFRACRMFAVAETEKELRNARTAAVEAIELHDSGRRA